MSQIFLGADHAALTQKKNLIEFLKSNFPKFEFSDLGTYSSDSVHYPDFAREVCTSVLENPASLGILLCGSGIGMSMAANRYQGIRAALCAEEEEARLSRQHNDANILCLGARLRTQEKLNAIAQAWLSASFEGGRHQQRLDMFNKLGQKLC